MIQDLIDIAFDLPSLVFGTKGHRTLKKTTSTSLSKVKDNQFVKVIGVAKTKQDYIISPISNLNCLHLKIYIGQEMLGGYTKDNVNHKQGVEFIIETDEGLCLIKSRFIESYLGKNIDKMSGVFNEPSPTLLKFLSKKKISTKSFGVNKTFNVQESLLQEGDKVTIYGKGKWTKNSNGQKYFVMSGDSKKPLLLSNLKKHFDK